MNKTACGVLALFCGLLLSGCNDCERPCCDASTDAPRVLMTEQLVMKIYDVSDISKVPPNIATHVAGAPPTNSTVQQTIQLNVAPNSWTASSGTSIEEKGGKLVVMQTPAVHKLIEALIGSLRKYNHVGELEIYDVRDLPKWPRGFLTADEAALPVEKQSVIEIVKRRIAPRSWVEGSEFTIDESNGKLVVFHVQAVHDAIRELLKTARKAAKQE